MAGVWRAVVLALLFGLAVCGCREKEPQANRKETTDQGEVRREADMGTTLQWLGHASFKICHDDAVIYIDPWKVDSSPQDATVVLVSHGHYDHYSAADVKKVSGADTMLIASADVVRQEGGGQAIRPGETVETDGIRVTGVAAYNPSKQFHPKANNWLGFVVEAGAKRIYYAGDTDLTAEMGQLKDIDVALLPAGGTYTLNAAEAAEATRQIKPKLAVPYHWGDIVGGRGDAEQFASGAECDVKVLDPGDTISLEQ
ncbi:MAG: MBL fold metallo-hydrolase [Phycisphaerales bacterium]|nr:MAG: MBL fold metallo-hydrolase [Phycisphaerales bacterium]